MDYNARYYNPRLGRFVSPDTVVPEEENPQHWNRYTYVYNNPIRYYDRDGHCLPFCIISAVMYRQRLANASSPDELTNFSRSVAEANIPIASHIAQKDVTATEELWQSYHGVDLEGNTLSNEQRSWLAQDAAGKAFEGVMETVGLAAAVYFGGKVVGNAVVTQREAAAGNALIDDVLENELKNVRMTVKPTYNPKLTNAYGASTRGQYSEVGRPSMQNGRLEVIDTILHEEMHQRLWTRRAIHSEKYISEVTKRFTQMSGLGVAPSHKPPQN